MRVHRKTVSIIPLILDEDLPHAAGSIQSDTVLTLPLGGGTVLDCLASRLGEVADRPAMVLSCGDGSRYAECVRNGRARSLRVLEAEDLAEKLLSLETSDCLLIVQPRYWPAAEHDFERLIEYSTSFRGATHAVAVGRLHSGARERVECDDSGQVRRVQRLYNEMSWPEAASSSILYSLVPAHLMAGVELTSLAALRTDLAARGVLTHDVPVLTEVDDLADRGGILTVNERMIERMAARPEPGYAVQSAGVLVGRNCRIDPSARLVGPIVLQDNAAVEAGAHVIGPTTIGSQGVVRRGAIVARSLLGLGAMVEPETTSCQEVILAGGHRVAGSVVGRSPGTNGDGFTIGSPGWTDGGQWVAAEAGRDKHAQRVMKRLLDVVVSATALVLLSPLFLLVALLIKLTSRGPVFFVHRRERMGGAEFPCIKFRSMVANAHRMQRELYEQNEVDGPQFKLANDPRETLIGHWLRRLNIDELPQLFNVLVGHMSLVGPRPSPFRENQICVAWRRARLSVRPGITGLWQICRDRRSDGDFHQWIYYDLAYVRHFSLTLDLRVLLYTLLSGGKKRVPLARLIPGIKEPPPEAEGLITVQTLAGAE